MPVYAADRIPYAQIACDLTGERQSLVPFLGAGASLVGRKSPSRASSSHKAASSSLHCSVPFTAKAAVLAELGICLSALLQEAQDRVGSISAPPPSSSELAVSLADRAGFPLYRRVVERIRMALAGYSFSTPPAEQEAALSLLSDCLGIANPPESLAALAGYFEALNSRDSLLHFLADVIPPTLEPTPLHRTLAAAAEQHLGRTSSSRFLLLTTNYDCMMETALDERQLPYVVLTRNRTGNMVLKCSPTVSETATLNPSRSNTEPPESFHFETRQPLVVLQKLHGCVRDARSRLDTIVISELDYVNSLSDVAGAKPFPVQVRSQLGGTRLLFLGYSLADWNVRSLLQRLRDHRRLPTVTRDLLVIRKSDPLVQAYYDHFSINVLEADLRDFAENLGSAFS
jgi:hypothetical protein